MQPMFGGRKEPELDDSKAIFWLYGGYGIDSTARGEPSNICGSSTIFAVHMAEDVMGGKQHPAWIQRFLPPLRTWKPGCGQQPGGLE